MALFKDGDVKHVVMDGHMSVLDGTIGIFLRRLMDLDEDYNEAHDILIAAEILDSGVGVGR